LDPSQAKAARDLLNPSFDFGRTKMCAAQEQAAFMGAEPSAVKVSLQHDLTEATNGLFHSDHQRQVQCPPTLLSLSCQSPSTIVLLPFLSA
jgi:hypothetical protein